MTNESGSPKILYMGPLSSKGTCFQRLRALNEIFCGGVFAIDSEFGLGGGDALLLRFIKRFSSRLYYFLLRCALRFCAWRFNPTIIWLDKPLFVNRSILKVCKIRGAKVCVYSPDDMMNPDNSNRGFVESCSLFDIFFTTKSYNVAELRALGVANVVFVNNAFCPWEHVPGRTDDLNLIPNFDPWDYDVSFVGSFEEDRFRSIRFLAENGVTVHVWGRWPSSCFDHINILHQGHYCFGRELSKVISRSRINLSFLRKANRDLQTTRTMEIPACGGLLVSEFSEEHAELFKHGSEAFFFRSDTELLSQVMWLQKNDAEVIAVSTAGRARVLSSGYDNVSTLKGALINTGVIERG